MGEHDERAPQARPAEVRVKLPYETVDAMVERFAGNIGTSGLFLPTATLHPVGTQLKFDLRLADDTSVMIGLGTVAATKQPNASNPNAAFGISLQLMRVSREGRALLLKMMERRRAIGLPEVRIPSADDVERARGLAHGAGFRDQIAKPIATPLVDQQKRRTVRIPDVVRIPERPSKDAPKTKDHATGPIAKDNAVPQVGNDEVTAKVSDNVAKPAIATPLKVATTSTAGRASHPAAAEPVKPPAASPHIVRREQLSAVPAERPQQTKPSAPALSTPHAPQSATPSPIERAAEPPQPPPAARSAATSESARVERPSRPRAGDMGEASEAAAPPIERAETPAPATRSIEQASKPAAIERDTASRASQEPAPRAPRRRRLAIAITGCLVAVAAGGALVYRQRSGPSDAPTPRATPRVAITLDAAVEPDQSARLIEGAERAISDGRIATPPTNNALELIVELERKHPGDARAQALRKRAVNQLLASAQTLWDHGKRESARRLYAEVLLFEPNNPTATPRSQGATAKFDTEQEAWLATQIDLAVVDRRLIEPPDRNALALLLELRKYSSVDEIVRIGSEVANAMVAEAKKDPDKAPALLVAAKQARGEASDRRRDEVATDVKTSDLPPAKQWIAKGNASLAAKRFAEATTSFERALASDASAPAALAGLAEATYNQGDFQRAVDSAKRAVAQVPRNVAFRMTLAKSYFKLGRYADAIEHWQKVLEIDPANKLAKKNVEMAKSKL